MILLIRASGAAKCGWVRPGSGSIWSWEILENWAPAAPALRGRAGRYKGMGMGTGRLEGGGGEKKICCPAPWSREGA